MLRADLLVLLHRPCQDRLASKTCEAKASLQSILGEHEGLVCPIN